MTSVTLVLFVAGLVLLLVGAEGLVRGASRLATRLGVGPTIIGLTVVAWGTSAPELAVSLRAAVVGQTGLTLGNIVGSNIANVLLILGLSACVVPLMVAGRFVRREVPILLLVSFATLGMAWDRQIGRLDASLLVIGLLAYAAWSIVDGRREAMSAGDTRARVAEPAARVEVSDGDPSHVASRPNGLVRVWRSGAGDVARVVVGLGLLLLGTRWLVDGATAIAAWLGMSDLVIGLTVVAVGTSLPEIAASTVAALRGEREIAVANVVGSNLYNLLAVLGITAFIHPLPVDEASVTFNLPVMVTAAACCLPVFFTGGRISRWEGGAFLAFYAAYVTYLVLDATDHALFGAYHVATLWIALPLALMTLGVVATQALRVRVRRRHARRRVMARRATVTV